MHRYAKRSHYLEAALKLARYFWIHLDDWLLLPRWDFAFQNQSAEPLDAAAASIAASGMLLLSDQLAHENRHEEAKVWLDRGTILVKSLILHCLYTSLDKYGIIEKATVDKPRNSGVGESTMYGDYYFAESVFRLLNRQHGHLSLLY